jgi:hypothetical protein
MDDLDNALMAQKDAILDHINKDQYEAAILLLQFSKRLWYSANYAYKFREVQSRLLASITLERNSAHHKAQPKLNALIDRTIALLNA